MLLFLLLSVCAALPRQWWSTLSYNCPLHDSMPDRECLVDYMMKHLKTVEPVHLLHLQEAVNMELDFASIKRTLIYVKDCVFQAASLGYTSLTVTNTEDSEGAEDNQKNQSHINTPLISCRGINDCDLFLHGLQQEIVYLFKGSLIQFVKKDNELEKIEIIWG